MTVLNFAAGNKSGPDILAYFTLGTAFIALLIPFAMARLEYRRTNRIRKERAHEATSATFNGLDVLVDAIKAHGSHDVAAYASACARAEGYVGVADVFLANPVLTDGSIFCLVNMRLAMKCITAGSSKAGAGQWNALKGDLASALALAHPANERGQSVRKNMKIGMRTCGYWPQLPQSI